MSTLLARPSETAPQVHPQHRFSYLLVAELVLILGFPLLQHMQMGLYGVLGIVVFAAALHAVYGEGRWTVLAFVLGIPAIAGNLLASSGYTRVFFVPGLICGALFLIFVTSLILKSVIAAARVTLETLYGSIAGYMMIGLTWGGVYFLLESVNPSAFHAVLKPGAVLPWADFMFFSFVTLTTVGYGDMVPVSALAKSLVMLESVMGVMYPAIMIARLVAIYSAGARER